MSPEKKWLEEMKVGDWFDVREEGEPQRWGRERREEGIGNNKELDW